MKCEQQPAQPRTTSEEYIRSHKLLKPAARLARSLVDVVHFLKKVHSAQNTLQHLYDWAVN
eukprot:7126035-Pyramimonas_sp.AAC.1